MLAKQAIIDLAFTENSGSGSIERIIKKVDREKHATKTSIEHMRFVSGMDCEFSVVVVGAFCSVFGFVKFEEAGADNLCWLNP